MVIKAESDLPEEEVFLSLGWKENPAAKRLLDTIVSILTEEYIQKAKENPEIFSK
jgi:hypothetical protein